jgi:hypothetical protein
MPKENGRVCKEESEIKLNFRMNKKYISSFHEIKIIWVYETHSVTFGR